MYVKLLNIHYKTVLKKHYYRCLSTIKMFLCLKKELCKLSCSYNMYSGYYSVEIPIIYKHCEQLRKIVCIRLTFINM